MQHPNYMMRVTSSTSKRIAIHQGIEGVQQRAIDHLNNLSLFQQWYETKLAEIRFLSDGLGLLEQLVLNSSYTDIYQIQTPLMLAVAYSKVAEKINRMESKKESKYHILKPLTEMMNLAATTCLVLSDKSKCALGEDEYSTMSASDRKKTQYEQFARILQFFNSAQDDLAYNPEKVVMENIILKLNNIIRPLTTDLNSKPRHVSFSLPQVSENSELGPNSELSQQVWNIARSQALLFELIKENEDVLQCFFLEKNQELSICSPDHLPPSKLLRCMCQVVTDILWENFQSDYLPSKYHVKVISRWRNSPTNNKLRSKTLFELWERYDSIKRIEQNYLISLYETCRASITDIVRKFADGCSCKATFHLHLITCTPPAAAN